MATSVNFGKIMKGNYLPKSRFPFSVIMNFFHLIDPSVSETKVMKIFVASCWFMHGKEHFDKNANLESE